MGHFGQAMPYRFPQPCRVAKTALYPKNRHFKIVSNIAMPIFVVKNKSPKGTNVCAKVVLDDFLFTPPHHNHHHPILKHLSLLPSPHL